MLDHCPPPRSRPLPSHGIPREAVHHHPHVGCVPAARRGCIQRHASTLSGRRESTLGQRATGHRHDERHSRAITKSGPVQLLTMRSKLAQQRWPLV